MKTFTAMLWATNSGIPFVAGLRRALPPTFGVGIAAVASNALA